MVVAVSQEVKRRYSARGRFYAVPNVRLIYGGNSRRIMGGLIHHFTSRKTAAVRLWQKINKTDGCWSYEGCMNSNGVPVVSNSLYGYSTVYRVLWQLFNGPIPEGDRLNNRCGNQACVRPDHWELTPSADVRKALKAAAREVRRKALFWNKVDKSGDCWEWQGAVNPKTGYGST